jgi:hypothetical protein
MALGEAFIEVHADTRPFGRELNRDVRRILRTTQRSVRRESSRLGESLGEGMADGLRRRMPAVRRTVEREVDKIKVKKEIEVDVDRNTLTRTGGRIVEWLSTLGQTATEIGGKFATGIAAGFSSIGAAVGNISSMAGNPIALAISVGLIGAAITALSGLVILLTSQLWNLLGLIGLFPGALAVFLGTLLPVVVAFSGFSDAIEAVLSKDPKKIAEALKALSPAAREVVQEFQRLLPWFENLRRITQEKFFEGIRGSLTQLITTLGPGLERLFAVAAGAVSTFISQLATALSDPRVNQFLIDLSAAIHQMITELGPAVIAVIMAFGEMAAAALPTLLELVSSFSGFLKDFAGFISSAVEDGRFQGWLDQALTTLGQIKDIASEFYDLLVTIFDEANASGSEFLDFVLQALRELHTFFKSKEGKDALLAMILLAQAFAGALYGAMAVALGLLSVLGAVARAIRGILEDLGLARSRASWVNPSGSSLGSNSVTSKGSGGGTGTGGKRAFAIGGMVTSPTEAILGEDGPEVVIPLTKPARAAELAAQSGLLGMLGDAITVHVYLGTREITEILDRRVERKLEQQGQALVLGSRVGV